LNLNLNLNQPLNYKRKTAVTLSAHTPRSGLPDTVFKSLPQNFLLSSSFCEVAAAAGYPLQSLAHGSSPP
ncbi:MAG: hypothetical protein PHQ33_07160, partial [Bacteroidales bacterium]|nr:hypothetical protein [Bacteroidales bacterium]